MAIDNQNIQDPTTSGLKGLKGLEGINRLRDRGINIDTSILNLANNYRGTTAEIYRTTSPRQNIGFVGIGDSKLDRKITSATQLDNLENTRGELQSGISQISNGLAKGAVLAGTTFLDGTIGLLFGAGQALNEFRISALWDNDFSKAMQSVNEWAENILPNYYTDTEKNEPWYENIFTANFLGDKFIKNLGFTVGAFYSGGVTAAGLKATKLPQIIGAVTKSSKAPAIVTSAVGATISAVNEGRIEALNNSTDWFELQKSQLDDKHAARLQMIEQYRGTEMYYSLLAQENANYQSTLEKLTEDRLKMGNADLLMNIPILTASNLVQFGRLYANGYKTARKATNIVGKAGEYATRKNAGIGIAKALFSAVSEGTEELAQKSASVAAGLRYEEDVNNFYKAKIDPDAEQETLNWIKALARGINQTVNDNSSEEEFFIASLTGALGMPKFRSIKSNEGKFQSPITLDEGFFGKYREYRNQQKREADIATYMNDRVNSPEFINYYQGLIRHNKYQKDMNLAVENGDEFEFKNAEHAQLVSDIAMFDNAGKLEDLITLINSAFDTSDENLTSIVENTTTTLEDGSKVGPFVDKNGNPMYSTPEGKKEMIDKLTQTKNEMSNTITNYTSIKDDIDIIIGQQLSDEQLQELTWLKSQITNWQDRASQLSSEVKPTIRSVAGSLGQLADMYHKIKAEEGKKYAHLTDLYNEADHNERTLRESIDIISTIIGLDDNNFAYLLSSNQEIVDGIKDIINDPISGIAVDDIQKIESKIDDIIKLVNATNNFDNKLKEYLENPKKLQKDIETAAEDISSKESKKKANTLKDSLTSATNLAEFREALNSEEDSNIKDETLKNLENEGNQLVKDYKEVNNYNKEVQKAINKLDEPHHVKMDALKLFQEQFNNSNNLSEIANPNSVFIDDEDILHDDTLTDDENIKRFQEAQYALHRAMNEVNNDNKFKDRFSQSYRVLKQKGNPVPNAPEKDTTGDSGTATIPTVDVDDLPTTTEDVPAGDVSSTQLEEENKYLNDQVETQDDLNNKYPGSRPYYRPAIPELHIEASKDGDFRPFDVVAKEREGLNFSEIYNYLRDSGAFKYVNEGNLKVGDELGFMIDPEFESTVEGQSWHTNPTIFIIDTRNNQVVGSLDESQYSVDRYEGLKSLEEKIRQEFSQVEDKTKIFVATPTTRVSQIMIGKIPYSKDEKSLADIDNVSSEDSEPIFGIVRNGVLFTNGRLDHDEVITPGDMTGKEGRMYLLIHNAAGKYSPAAVRVKHFNRSEFNPEDVIVQGTPMFKRISNAINKLATSNTEEDVEDAIKELKKYLYIGRKKDRTSYIKWFTSSKGDGIRFTKITRNASGERTGKEYEKVVYFTEKSDPSTSKSVEQLEKEITNILLDFNLPIQVNAGMLNTGLYNNILITSGVLTSNITDARVLSSWFTTDYFDEEGNLKKAINPTSLLHNTKTRNSPVGGTEGVISGTQVSMGGTVYYVDLEKNIVTDLKGNSRPLTDADNLLSDLAWAQNNFGNATQSLLMVDNKVVTPSGRVLDRKTQKYLSNEDAQKIKDKIANREKATVNTDKVISQIEENQRKVDKSKTDGDYYYILEEDGQHHEYERVHSRLGNNWVESKKQTDALRDTKLKLVQLVDNTTQYNNYLTGLSKHYGVDLTAFSGKTDAKSRDTIVAVIRDSMASTKSQRALKSGTAIDSIVRSFFTSTDTPTKPDNMSEEAFTDLLTSLTEIKSNIEARGEKFLANNIVLFQKYSDGTRVAGEVDILSIDTDGNFRIYDVKTRGYSFYVEKGLNLFDWTINGKKGTKEEVQDYINEHFKKPFTLNSNMSDKDYYTLQLSAYKNLFESQYNTPITSLGILPFALTYNNKDIVTAVNKEKGIIITYNPAVNVPLVSKVKANPVTPTNSAVPIFNSTNEILDPINDVLPEFSLEDSKVGYFVRDGKLHKGFLSYVGQVNGIDVHMTKVPDITNGFGRTSEKAHVGVNSYYAVFPNGNTIALINNDPFTMTEQKAKDTILGLLNGNPQRVFNMSNEKTLIFDPSNDVSVEPAKPGTGAAKSVNAGKEINPDDDEFEESLDDSQLRAVDTERPIWNKEEELAWIKKVLPQLSDNDRVRVVKGLIRVANSGAYAWGQFNNGIITLSDIAAEGTAYHEAFHVVFSSLLNPIERVGILKEAEKKFGKKNAKDLEEDLAEEFREFVMQGGKDTRSLGTKILDFFKSLLAKVFNWKYFTPSAIYYYRAINNGYYSNKPILSENSINTNDNNVKYRLLSTEELDSIIQEEYNNAKKTVQSLNNRRYLTKEDALRSFRDSGINPDLFYRITGPGANNAIGHKIQILNIDMFDKYKEAILEEHEFYLRHSIKDQEIDVNWDRLDPEIQMYLLNKGWTQEKFDSISQIERDYAIRCASI